MTFDNVFNICMIGFGTVFAIAWLIVALRAKKNIDLHGMAGVFLSGAMLPIGGLFLWCAVDPSQIKFLGKFPVYLALVGIVVLYFSAEFIWKKIKSVQRRKNESE